MPPIIKAKPTMNAKIIAIIGDLLAGGRGTAGGVGGTVGIFGGVWL